MRTCSTRARSYLRACVCVYACVCADDNSDMIERILCAQEAIRPRMVALERMNGKECRKREIAKYGQRDTSKKKKKNKTRRQWAHCITLYCECSLISRITIAHCGPWSIAAMRPTDAAHSSLSITFLVVKVYTFQRWKFINNRSRVVVWRQQHAERQYTYYTIKLHNCHSKHNSGCGIDAVTMANLAEATQKLKVVLHSQTRNRHRECQRRIVD